MRRRGIASAFLALATSACLGPVPDPPAQSAIELPQTWRFPDGLAAVDIAWWRAFGDPELTAVVENALAHNPDIGQAVERVTQARAQERGARANRGPEIDFVNVGGYQRVPSAPPISYASAFPQATISWDLDFFGKLKEADPAARASVVSAEGARAAVRLSIASTAATSYITLLSLDARLAIIRTNQQLRGEFLHLARRRADVGYTSTLELREAQAEYDSAAALEPATLLSIAQAEDALSILTGHAPHSVPRSSAGLDGLRVPPIPGGLPSSLLERRPDVYAAGQAVVAADHSLLSARANLLPDFSLTGFVGDSISQVMPHAELGYVIANGILAPIFDSGRRRAIVDDETALRDQAAYFYKSTVLGAVRDVDDSLAAIERNREQVELYARQVDAEQQTLRVARDRYLAGYSPYFIQIDADRQLLAAQLDGTQARSAWLIGYVTLYQALGGGWRRDPGPARKRAHPVARATPSVQPTATASPPGASCLYILHATSLRFPRRSFMSVNHFMVSLGGTGARVLRAFRKRTFSEFKGRSADTSKKLSFLDSIDDVIYLQYLMVDSSAAMFGESDSWKVLGTSVKPQDLNWLHLRQSINVPDWIRNSRQYPGVAEWIGDQSVWKEVPDTVLGGDAGGQRRRLGRLLFAANAERFRARIVELNAALSERSKRQGTTFHLLCGLAGGTGSGSIIDAIAQISKISSHPDDRIIVYAVLPERTPLPGKKQTYYHANAYAALRELNGVLVGAYKPWDVLNGSGSIAVGSKLKSVYLISNENERGYQVRMDDDTDVGGGLSEIVGDYLFQKIVVDPISGRASSPIETSENASDLPETLARGKAGRSRRFFSFGINRIAIPEEEIVEYFALATATRAANHLQFNNWSELSGWRAERLPRNFHEEVHRPEPLARWKLTDGHLLYELPILPRDANRGWRPTLAAEWEDWAAHAIGDVQDSVDSHEWLDEVARQFQSEYEKGFRGQGVDEFFRTRIASARAISQEIRGTLERELFKAWRDGTYALADLRELVTTLRLDVEVRIGRLRGLVPVMREDVDAAAADMEAVRERWRRRVLGFGKRRLFDEMRSACLSYQSTATQIAATAYLEQLAPLLIRELTALETSIQEAEQRIDGAAEKLKLGVDARLPSAARADHIVRIVDGQRVRDTIQNVFLLNRDVQWRLAQAARDALIGEKVLGEEPTFQKFIERWPEGELTSKLEVTAEQAASREHDAATLEEGKRILGVSLLRKLRQDYSGRGGDLVGFVREAMQNAAPFVRLNAAEVQASGPEYGLDPTVSREPLRSALVHYPAAQDMPDFVKTLESAFREVHTGGEIGFSARADRQNEITVVTVLSAFPARYVDLLKLIYDAYTELMADDRQARRVKMELHTADQCAELPHLFPETGPPPDVASYLVLAELLGIVSQSRSAATGQNQFLLHSVDGDGIPQTHLLGATFEQSRGSLHGEAAAILRDELNAKLQERKHEDEKEGMKRELRTRLQATLDKLQDPQHPTYLEQRAAVSGAAKLITAGRV